MRNWARGISPSAAAFAALGLLVCAGYGVAQTPEALSSPSALKKLSLEQLMDVEVTSVSKRAEKLSETASAIQVITGEDIRRSGASSLPEALRLASNLEVAQVDSRQWAISARGFNSTSANKLLVLIDGRAVYTPLYAGVFWDVQDTMLEDIDRIEVISGPGATLWGANAVNGVINITTRSAKDTQGLLLLGGGGTELRDFGGFRYGGALASNVFYRVYGKYFDRDSAVLPSGQDATNNWRMGQGGFRLDREDSDVNLLTLQGDVYSGRIAQAGLDDTAVSGGNVLGRWTHRMSLDSDFKLQFYYDRTHRFVPGTFTEDLNTYDADFQHRALLGERNDIVWGLGYRLLDDKVGNTPALAFLPAKVSRQVFSAFGQDEIALVKDRLHLTLGTKIEHNDYTGFEFQPSGRLAWNVSQGQTLWGAISRAVRTPSRIDREFYAPGSPPFVVLVGGTNFVSEELLAYELGYRLQPIQRLSLSLAGFYNDYDNVRSVEQLSPPAPFPITLANRQRGNSYGAEFTADYRATDWLRLRAGYTELQIHIRPKSGSTDVSKGSVESSDPNHQFFLRSSLDLPGHFQFDAALRYVTHLANQGVPAYAELDARLAWEPIPKLEFSIVGQNLLHHRHPEFGAQTGPMAAPQDVERGVYGKALWRF
jgi:iron complex outermembrane receptor protein